MRSTVDLENTLDKRLREQAAALGISFKEALNRALAAGLHALENKPQRTKYKVRARACGFQPGIDQEKLGPLLDHLEAEDFLKKQH
jgi:hypothetical protein